MAEMTWHMANMVWIFCMFNISCYLIREHSAQIGSSQLRIYQFGQLACSIYPYDGIAITGD